MLKPQAIKDQEFQVKFRGYDPVEVRNFLELLAEDFFELLEQNQELKEQIDTLEFNSGDISMDLDLDSLDEVEGMQFGLDDDERKKFEERIRELSMRLKHAEGMMERAGTENMGYLSQVGELSQQLEMVEAEVAQGQQQLAALGEKVTLLTADNSELDEKVKMLTAENGHLEDKVTLLTAENSDLKKSLQRAVDKGEVDELQRRISTLETENRNFRDEEASVKKALAAAQTFAENSKENAEKEAARILEEARESAGKLQLELAARADSLPREIEELIQRKEQARRDVRSVLERYLAALDDESAEAPPETGHPQQDDSA